EDPAVVGDVCVGVIEQARERRRLIGRKFLPAPPPRLLEESVGLPIGTVGREDAESFRSEGLPAADPLSQAYQDIISQCIFSLTNGSRNSILIIVSSPAPGLPLRG